MTIKEVLVKYRHVEIELLLSQILGRSKEFLFAHPEFILASSQRARLKKLAQRRLKGEPMAYVLGYKDFYGLRFKVNKDVLIPRPETEGLVELGYKKIVRGGEGGVIKILDVGTGSGCIIITLAKELGTKNHKFYASDISKKALNIAKINARRHGVLKKIKFLHGHLLDPLLHLPLPPIRRAGMRGRAKEGHSNLIIANLPYLTLPQYQSNLDLKHEHPQALVGGRDGLKYFRELFKKLQKIVCPPELACPVACQFIGSATGDFGSAKPDSVFRQNDIVILLEHSPLQKTALTKLAKKFLPKAQITFHKDMGGKWRFLEIRI